MEQPLFSIITINRNNAPGLRETLEATFAQTCRDYEQIVIDGASTDASKDVIGQYAAKIAYSVSEPDSGIYNAMNKGIRAARGKYMVFMNSGDYFWNPYVLEAFADAARQGEYDMLFGDYMLDDERGGAKRIPQADELGFGLFNPPLSWGIRHQSVFYRADLVSRLGGYDESYFIAADWKFTLRALAECKATSLHLPVPVAFYDYRGLSSRKDNFEKSRAEALRACEETIPAGTWREMQREARAFSRERKKKTRRAKSFSQRIGDAAWHLARRCARAYLKRRERA